MLAHIAQISAHQSVRYAHVLVGPGDDCAVVAPANGPALLLKVDQLVEGRHVALGTSAVALARKALARAVSDIAAMAGTPLCALVGATLGPGTSQERAQSLADALHTAGEALGCPIVGGDVASFAPASGVGAACVLSISVVGLPHATRGPVLRSGARAGDAVWMTGHVGASLDPATGLGHHLTFTPRLAEATWLANTLGPDLHALMDVSDGLGIDAGRMARASGVRIALEGATLPLRDPARGPARSCADGEDYELLFTTPSDVALPPTCPTTGTRFTRIGVALAPGSQPASPASVLRVQDQELDVSASGWTHE